jgi:hypothetical protein
VRREKPELGVAIESQVERAVTLTSLRFRLRRMPSGGGSTKGQDVRESISCEEFLLKLGEVSFKAGEESS